MVIFHREEDLPASRSCTKILARKFKNPREGNFTAWRYNFYLFLCSVLLLQKKVVSLCIICRNQN